MQAYNELRMSAQLVLNLLRLMHGCAIRDLQVSASACRDTWPCASVTFPA